RFPQFAFQVEDARRIRTMGRLFRESQIGIPPPSSASYSWNRARTRSTASAPSACEISSGGATASASDTNPPFEVADGAPGDGDPVAAVLAEQLAAARGHLPRPQR